MTFYVYMMTNKNQNVLYTGITNDLVRRVYQHKTKSVKSFTERYNVNCLVYFEVYSDPINAIEREKQIKSWSRKKKNKLIEIQNQKWEDLYDGLCL